MKRRFSFSKKNSSDDSGEQGFWPSYADMMSSFALILFFLMLLSYIQNLVTGNNLQNTQELLNTTETKRYIQTLVDYSITKGTTATTFSPNMKLTRGQLATFLYNAIQTTSDDLTIISVE